MVFLLGIGIIVYGRYDEEKEKEYINSSDEDLDYVNLDKNNITDSEESVDSSEDTDEHTAENNMGERSETLHLTPYHYIFDT